MDCKQTLRGEAGIVYSISWAPEGPCGGQLVCGTSKGAVVVWDAALGMKKATMALYSATHPVYRVAWNQLDSSQILTAAGDGIVYLVTPAGEVRQSCQTCAWVCGCVGAWVRGCVGVWVCGWVGVWVCGCVGVWVCGCVRACRRGHVSWAPW
jgi:hypothetical protein